MAHNGKLALTRTPRKDRILIQTPDKQDIWIAVSNFRREKVTITIEADTEFKIVREELLEKDE